MDGGAQGDGRHGYRNAQRMVGQAHQHAERLSQVWNSPKMHLFRRRRVRARTLQQCQLRAALLPHGGDCLVNFGQAGHPRGYDHRLAGAGDAPDQQQIHRFERGDLISRHVHLLQKIDCREIEGRGKEVHPQIVRDELQLRLPLPWSIGFTVQVVQIAPLPEPLRMLCCGRAQIMIHSP